MDRLQIGDEEREHIVRTYHQEKGPSLMKLVVRRVVEGELEDGVFTAVKFRQMDGLPASTADALDLGTAALLTRELSFVYPGPARHHVGDSISLQVLFEGAVHGA